MLHQGNLLGPRPRGRSRASESIFLLLQGDNFVSKNCREDEIKALLRDELETYSYQFKSATTVFNKEQVALSGKVGGMRDDLAILLQLAAYWTGQVFVSE